jgi:hypothetical protein
MSEKMTTEEVNEYMMKQCGFVPRMFKIINTVTPDPGRTFADFYASIFGDGALSKKVKEPEMHNPCYSCNKRGRNYW